MRVGSCIAAGALLAALAASCLSRTSSHRAVAQAPAAEAAAPAATPAKAGAAKPPETATREIIMEHADRVRYDNKTKDYTLTGDIVVRHEKSVLRAQSMRLNRDTKKGVATGELSFTNADTVITAERLEIDYDARVGVFKGSVRMVTQRKPATSAPKSAATAAKPGADDPNKSLREYWSDRTEITCPALEYDYRLDRAAAHQGITARQKDRTGSADEATYDNRAELLVLSGHVQMKDERNQTFQADKITISIKDDWIEAEGGVASRFLVEEEKEPTSPAPAPPAATAKPAS